MDDPKRIVLDISSDEDVGWGESGVTCDGGGCGGVRDDGDWISELLDEVRKTIDDSDELLVVGEVTANPRHSVAKSLVKFVDDKEEESEDECVVLDGDPDKPIAIENDGGEDSDDLCVVGEKGQIACRDYPHPRHLCVKFPFKSTPHERHCDQCHCYVCDTVAPCVLWGSGASSIDHCHATEKDEFWKAQRKSSRTSNKATPLVSGLGSTPMGKFLSLPCNRLMHNQEQPASQPCSITSISTPNSVMPVRTQVSGYDPNTKFRPQLVSYHLQRHSVDHARNRSISQHVPFKRPGMVGGVFAANRFGNNLSQNNHSYQFSRNYAPGSGWQVPGARENPLLSTYQDSNQANFSGIAAHSVPNSPTWSPINNGLGNCAPLEPQIASYIHNSSVNANSAAPYPQLSSQPCEGSNFANSTSTVPGVAMQQRWGSAYGDPMPLQPQGASQPNVGRTCQNVVPSQLLVTSNGYINYAESPASAQSVVSFQPNTSGALQNPLCYQQLSGQPPAVPDNVRNRFRQGNQAQNSSSSADVSFNQDTYTRSVPVECTQLLSTTLGENPAIAINSQSPSSSNPHPVDSHFDGWNLEDKSALDYLEIPMSPGFNLYSSESGPMDAGLLYDI